MANTTEIIRRIWNDDEGVCIEIRPDQDGFGVIELHTPDEKSKTYYGDISLTIERDVARKIGKALIAAADDEVDL